MTVPQRAVLYLRVSRRRGRPRWHNATNDRHPEFQRMIEGRTFEPAPFDVVVVHSFSRSSSSAITSSWNSTFVP